MTESFEREYARYDALQKFAIGVTGVHDSSRPRMAS
jgi:hypothetical protein